MNPYLSQEPAWILPSTNCLDNTPCHIRLLGLLGIHIVLAMDADDVTVTEVADMTVGKSSPPK